MDEIFNNIKTVAITDLNEINSYPFQVIGSSINFIQENIERLDGFNYHQFIWFSKGEGEIVINGEKKTLKCNDIVFLPKGAPHKYYSVCDKWISNWVCFSGWACDKLLNDFKLNVPIIFNLNKNKIFVSLMNSINNSMKSDRLYKNEYASANLYTLIVEANKMIKDINSKNDAIINSSIINAIAYMENKYFEDISMNDLCLISNLSESQLCRLFQKHFHMRPMEYLLQTRIQQAKNLLVSTSYPIFKISEMVGYENPTYFAMLFKRTVGMTPTDYKKHMS